MNFAEQACHLFAEVVPFGLELLIIVPDCYSDLFFCEVLDSKLKSDRCSFKFPLVELISRLLIGIINCDSETCFLKLTG